MAALSGRKGMMKFGTNALIMSVRHPVLMAKELATLDFLSEGRLLLVAGLGGEDPLEYEACGVTKPERARRTDEALEAMRLLWTQDKATFQGRYFRFTDVSVTPKPVQQPGPPVWIGGRSDAAMRRTGRLGDGWLPSAITPRSAPRASTPSTPTPPRLAALSKTTILGCPSRVPLPTRLRRRGS